MDFSFFEFWNFLQARFSVGAASVVVTVRVLVPMEVLGGVLVSVGEEN